MTVLDSETRSPYKGFSGPRTYQTLIWRSSATGPQGVPGVPPRYRGRPGGRLQRSPPLKLENFSIFFLRTNLIQVFFLHADLSHTVVFFLHTTFLIPVSCRSGAPPGLWRRLCSTQISA